MKLNLAIIAWVLTAVLAGAKLLGTATLSWWAVFSPVLALIVVQLTLLLIVAIIAVIAVFSGGKSNVRTHSS